MFMRSLAPDADARVEPGEEEIGHQHADDRQHATNIRMKPARNWSWLFSARSRIGPTVGRLSTSDTSTEPEIRCGQEVADIRDEGVERHPEGIFEQRPGRRQALRLGGHVVLLAEFVERFARMRRIMAAVPAEPDDQRRDDQVRQSDWIFGQSQGCPRISAS
jgi:hypothetical protein